MQVEKTLIFTIVKHADHAQAPCNSLLEVQITQEPVHVTPGPAQQLRFVGEWLVFCSCLHSCQKIDTNF